MALLVSGASRASAYQAVARAEQHAGQLRAYASTLESATPTPLLGAFIHLPVSGLAVPVGLT